MESVNTMNSWQLTPVLEISTGCSRWDHKRPSLRLLTSRFTRSWWKEHKKSDKNRLCSAKNTADLMFHAVTRIMLSVCLLYCRCLFTECNKKQHFFETCPIMVVLYCSQYREYSHKGISYCSPQQHLWLTLNILHCTAYMHLRSGQL